MIRFDTIKFGVPVAAVDYFDSSNIIENQLIDYQTGKKTTVRKVKSEFLPIGCSQIQCLDEADFQVTMSAKTLAADYLNGIYLGNFDRAISSLSDVIEINTGRLFDLNPIVYRIDVTDNVQMCEIGATKRDLIEALISTKANSRFITKVYDSSKTLGVEFAGTQQERNRLICYDKKMDLTKSANKQFIKSLTGVDQLKMFTTADKTIRIESNIANFKAIRNRLQIQTNNLRDVLTSEAPVNHNFLRKIMNDKSSQLSIFEFYDKCNFKEIDFIHFVGINSIINECNNDEKTVRYFFKNKVFAGNSNKFKYWYYKGRLPVKELIRKINIDKSNIAKEKIESITDKLLTQLLKTA